MKRVLVLGSGEFIGDRVALALAREGIRAVVAGGRGAGGEGIERLSFALQDAASMGRALRGIDGVVNCLSASPGSIARGAAALYAGAALQDAPPRIVHLSSMSVYGAVHGNIVEDAPLRGELGAYAQAKIAAEGLAAGYRGAVILRPGVEFGPGGELWSGRVARWLAARRLGDLGAAGDGYCNLIFIDDLVEAILNALRRPGLEGGVFNVAMPDPPTWNAYLVAYARALGAVPVQRISQRRLAVETKMLAVPLKLLEIAARGARLPWQPPPAVPPSLLGLMRQEIRLVSGRAQAALDLRCHDLDWALAQTAAWWAKSQGPGPRGPEARP
jgi:nucleoside-diphosphate-sugar epimerase